MREATCREFMDENLVNVRGGYRNLPPDICGNSNEIFLPLNVLSLRENMAIE